MRFVPPLPFRVYGGGNKLLYVENHQENFISSRETEFRYRGVLYDVKKNREFWQRAATIPMLTCLRLGGLWMGGHSYGEIYINKVRGKNNRWIREKYRWCDFFYIFFPHGSRTKTSTNPNANRQHRRFTSTIGSKPNLDESQHSLYQSRL